MEGKIKGGEIGNSLAKDNSLFLAYITKDDEPVWTGIVYNKGVVIVPAYYINDVNACPEKYKVHYKKKDKTVGTIGVVNGISHTLFDEAHQYSHNVGMIQVSLSTYVYQVSPMKIP